MGKTLRTGISMLKIRPVLLKILLIGFFYGFYSEGLDRLWIPHVLERFQLPQQGQAVMVGWVGGLSAASMVVTFFTTGILRKWLGETIQTKQLRFKPGPIQWIVNQFYPFVCRSQKVNPCLWITAVNKRDPRYDLPLIYLLGESAFGFRSKSNRLINEQSGRCRRADQWWSTGRCHCKSIFNPIRINCFRCNAFTRFNFISG